MVQRILFVAPSPLGDALLTTGVLDHLLRNNPNARFTIVCSGLNAPLFRNVPRLDRLVIVEKQRYAQHWLGAFLKLAATPWHLIIDFRNVGIFHLLPTRRGYRAHKRDYTIHKVEENARVLGVPPQDPHLWFDDKALAKAAALLPPGRKYLGFGPMSSSPFKEWAPERFAELGRRLTAQGAALEGAHIALFASEGERRRAAPILELMPAERRVDLIGKTDPLEAAACLARLDLYVGNDSGLMHMAAATGVPTLGLFGTGYPTVYRPWGKRTAFVERFVENKRNEWRAMSIDDMAGLAMTAIDVDTVEAAAIALLK